MTPLYQDRFVEFFLDDVNSIIEMVWSPESCEMSDNDVKHAFLTYAALVEHYRPSTCLTYSRGGEGYIIMPNMQQWIAENIMPRTHRAGIGTVAFVVSPNIFVQVSAEQLMDEPQARDITTRFFPSVETARQWLLRLQKYTV